MGECREWNSKKGNCHIPPGWRSRKATRIPVVNQDFLVIRRLNEIIFKQRLRRPSAERVQKIRVVW